MRYMAFSSRLLLSIALLLPVGVPALEITGFLDGRLAITDESRDPPAMSGRENPAENQLQAAAEIDLQHTLGAVSLRADIDLYTAGALDASGTPLDSGALEQALIAWQADPDLRLQAGVFNDPFGQEAEDIVDRRFSSPGAVHAVLDSQTAELRGNNLAGLLLEGRIGDVGLSLGAVNDIGKRPGTKAEGKNSLLVVLDLADALPDGLALELGVLSQEEYNAATNPDSAGTLYDLNAEYGWRHAGHSGAVGLDYLVASDIADAAWDVWFECAPRSWIAGGLRFGGVSWDRSVAGGNAEDNTVVTVYLAYRPAPGLSLALEVRDGSANAGRVLSGGLSQGDLSRISGISEGRQAFIDLVARF